MKTRMIFKPGVPAAFAFCMDICMHLCVFVCVCACVCVHVSACVRASVLASVYLSVFRSVCVSLYRSVSVSRCVRVRVETGSASLTRRVIQVRPGFHPDVIQFN